MNKYKGLFTFDVDNHKYIPIANTDGIIDGVDYRPGEEAKEYWCIDYDGGLIPFSIQKETATDKMAKSIGNRFDSEEEAEQAVEKLKAWTRLEAKGFRFTGWEDCNSEINTIYFSFPENKWGLDTGEDLGLLFGGKE